MQTTTRRDSHCLGKRASNALPPTEGKPLAWKHSAFASFSLKFDTLSWSLQCLAFDFLLDLDTLIHVPFRTCPKLPSVILEEGAECVRSSFMKPHVNLALGLLPL